MSHQSRRTFLKGAVASVPPLLAMAGNPAAFGATDSVRVRILGVCFQSVEGDIKGNVSRATALIRKATKQSPVDLVVLPELFTCGYCDMNLQPWAEDQKSDTFGTFDAFGTLANELDAVIGWGFAESSGSQKVYNSYALVEPGGRVSIVRKTHLHISTPGTRANEPEFLLPGDRLGIVDTRFGRLGVVICYDGWFVEVPRSLVLQGADCILWPSRSGGCIAGTGLPRARAIDNLVPIVQIDGSQTGGQLPMSSHSQIFDHTARQLADSREKQGLLRASLDLAEVRRFRAEEINIYAQYRIRRPELYGPITKPVPKK